MALTIKKTATWLYCKQCKKSSSYMWNLEKNGTNELVCKTEIESQIKK